MERCRRLAIAIAMAAPVAAQQSPQIDFKSVGRGAPVMVGRRRVAGDRRHLPRRPGKGPGNQANNQGTPPRTFVGSAPPGETPKGIEPLPRDMFTSDDFYKDKELWSDPRYFRCNSTRRDRGHVDAARRDRRQRPEVGGLGTLRQRLSARSDREPVSVQDGARALRGAEAPRRRSAAARRSTRTRPCPATSGPAATAAPRPRAGTRRARCRSRRCCRC